MYENIIKYTHIRYLSLSTMCTNNTVTFIDSYQTHAIWSGGYKEYHEEGDYQQQLRRPMNFSTEYEHAYDFLFMENQGRLNRARFHCGGAWNRIQWNAPGGKHQMVYVSGELFFLSRAEFRNFTMIPPVFLASEFRTYSVGTGDFTTHPAPSGKS